MNVSVHTMCCWSVPCSGAANGFLRSNVTRDLMLRVPGCESLIGRLIVDGEGPAGARRTGATSLGQVATAGRAPRTGPKASRPREGLLRRRDAPANDRVLLMQSAIWDVPVPSGHLRSVVSAPASVTVPRMPRTLTATTRPPTMRTRVGRLLKRTVRIPSVRRVIVHAPSATGEPVWSHCPDAVPETVSR
jgi:hypothetical protein